MVGAAVFYEYMNKFKIHHDTATRHTRNKRERHINGVRGYSCSVIFIRYKYFLSQRFMCTVSHVEYRLNPCIVSLDASKAR